MSISEIGYPWRVDLLTCGLVDHRISSLRSSAVPAVRLDIVVPAGQAEQERLLQALFTNRLLREGTADHSAAVLAERLDHLGAWLELSVAVHHSFVTLYTLRRHVPETFRLVRDMLQHPTFPEDRFEVVRQNNLSQYLVGRQRGDVVARRLFATAVYGPQHPCGRFADEADYRALTRDDLVRFHATHYRPSAFALFLSGDVDDEVEELAAEMKTPSPFPYEGESLANVPELHASHPSLEGSVGSEPFCYPLSTAQQDSIRMGGLMMDVGSDDYYLMRIVTAILGGYFGSRLMRIVREQQGLTYGINADLFTNTRQVLFVVSSEAAAGHGREVVDEVRRQCCRLCDEPVPADELERVRGYMLGEIYRNYEGVYNLVDAHIYAHTLGLPPDHLQRSIDTIRTATSDALLAVARRWLCPDRFHTVIVTPKEA